MLSLFVLLHLGLNVASAVSSQVTVKEVLALPESYQLHTVTLHGTVSNLQKVPPYSSRRGFCNDSHLCTLTDETGSIQVLIEGICGTQSPVIPIPLPSLVKEGEIIFIEGTVQAIDPASIPQPPNTTTIIGGEQGVRVLAQKIWR